MQLSKIHRSAYLCLLTLAGCSGAGADERDDTATQSSALTTTTCTTPAITEYPLPAGYTQPNDIVGGPDGNVWFAAGYPAALGALSPSTGTFTMHPVRAGSAPSGVTVGPDGNLWFTESLANRVGTMPTSGAPVTEYVIAVPNSGSDDPGEITPGPDGAMWFTGGAQLTAITTTGAMTDVGTNPLSASQLGQSLGIVEGPDQNIWFTTQQAQTYGSVNVLVPGTGNISTFVLSSPSGAVTFPWGVTVGPDKNLWIAGTDIWKVSPGGQVLGNYPVPGVTGYDNEEPANIATGPDGNLWFTEYTTSQVGQITPGGAITLWTVGGGSAAGPDGIAAGPGGDVWFTETLANKIGRITPSVCTTTTCTTVDVCESATGARLAIRAGSSCAAEGGHMAIVRECY